VWVPEEVEAEGITVETKEDHEVKATTRGAKKGTVIILVILVIATVFVPGAEISTLMKRNEDQYTQEKTAMIDIIRNQLVITKIHPFVLSRNLRCQETTTFRFLLVENDPEDAVLVRRDPVEMAREGHAVITEIPPVARTTTKESL
jgi:hypothetical protein